MPWDNPDGRKTIVIEKLKNYRRIVEEAKEIDGELVIEELAQIEELIKTEDYETLVVADEKLSDNLCL